MANQALPPSALATSDISPDITEERKCEKKDVEALTKNTTIQEGNAKITDDERKYLDQAEIFLQEHNISHAYIDSLLNDETARKKVVRKVDRMLMPLLIGTYLLQFIDKQALSYSASFDLFATTRVTSDQYTWLASIFYFAYLVTEWPAGYLTQHFPTGTVISVFIIIWGSILAITAACTNFAGLMVCRFLLGSFESAIAPCFMMIVGMWYSRRDQPVRAAAFYSANGVGQMIGGILFYAVGQAKGFAVWRAIFILCGGVTACWGVVIFIFLPNNIMSARRFSNEEKAVLIAQGQSNSTGIYNKTIKFSQVKEALLDPQVWLLFWFMLLNELINGGTANFGTLILKGIANGDALRTTLLNIPGGAMQVIFILSGGFLSGYFKNIRTYVMALYVVPTMMGALLLWKLDRTTHSTNHLLGPFLIVSARNIRNLI